MKNNFIVAGILLATLTTSTVAAQNKNSGEAKEKSTIEYSTLPKVDLKDFKKNNPGKSLETAFMEKFGEDICNI